MNRKQGSPERSATSRRDFIKRSSLLMATGAMAGTLNIAQAAHPFGSDTIKIGLIGCGGRGTGAANQAMNTMGGGLQLTAMADAFPDRLQAAYRAVKSEHKDKVNVPADRQFAGLDGYQKVLESGVDVVILATPPGFRPLHFEAAVKAGKHIFMEKPVAVDPTGVRRVLEAAKEAKAKNLAVGVGLQRRHEDRYRETIARLRDGAIGDIIASRVYWNGAGVWTRPRQQGWTEMEYQMRNWYYFNWLCGDHIVEQHIHNLDVINWLKDAYPIEANGMGGRQWRGLIADPEAKDRGQIFDHHFVEFTYADGHKMFSQCRHIPNCWDSVSEHVHGSNGSADLSGAKIYYPSGKVAWSYGSGGGDGHQVEHHHLFADLRAGRIPNEAEYGAMSTMTSILGRMATYSGQKVTMEEALASEVALAPIDQLRGMDDTPPIMPDKNGNYPVAIPGLTSPIGA